MTGLRRRAKLRSATNSSEPAPASGGTHSCVASIACGERLLELRDVIALLGRGPSRAAVVALEHAGACQPRRAEDARRRGRARGVALHRRQEASESAASSRTEGCTERGRRHR